MAASSTKKTGCSAKKPAAKKSAKTAAKKAEVKAVKKAPAKKTAKKTAAAASKPVTVTKQYEVQTDRWGNPYVAIGGSRVFFKNINHE